ncbi:hypothetical protein EMCRGX_G012031 [Ephydatia muelleri]
MTLLFPSWNISTVQGLVGSIFAMLFLSIFYEGLKSFREYLMHVAVKSLGASSNSCSDAKPAPGKPNWRSIFLGKSKLPLLIHVIQSILQMIQIGVAYLLMLAVMTYNGWIFLAIVFGSGIGYLIFGWTKFLYGVDTRPTPTPHHSAMQDLSYHLQLLLAKAVAPSTATTYTTGIRCYQGFCQSFPVPGIKEAVTLFAAHLSLSLQSKIVKVHVASLYFAPLPGVQKPHLQEPHAESGYPAHRGAHPPKAHTTATESGNVGSGLDAACGLKQLENHLIID